jgi:uncharacterized protein
MEKKIKDYLGIVIIIVLLSAGYGVLSYTNTYSKISEPSSFRSFSVSGEGEIVAIPDIAQFTFSVITEGGSDINALQKENTESVNEAISFLKNNKISEKDIKTQSYSVEPRYQYYNCNRFPVNSGGEPTACPPPSITGYTIRQVVEVKIRNFEKIGDVIGGVVDRGANSVSQLSFTIDDPSSLENDARAKAIEQAKEKAKSIADAGGFRLGKLLSINESGFPEPYYGRYGMGGDFAIAESASLNAPAPKIEPGSQEIKITVNLQYEIK